MNRRTSFQILAKPEIIFNRNQTLKILRFVQHQPQSQLATASGKQRKMVPVAASDQQWISKALGNLDGWIYAADMEHRLQASNAAVERFLGRPFSYYQHNPRAWAEQVHSDDYPAFEARLQNALGIHRSEYRVVRPDGSILWLSERTCVVPGASGEPLGYHGIAFEITEQKKAELNLAANLKKEIELSANKSKFISMAAHELRTPLAGILHTSELLEDYGGKLPLEKIVQYARLIRSGACRIDSLIGNILLLGKAQSKQLGCASKLGDIRQMLESWLKGQPEFQSSLGRISLTFESRLPKCSFDAILLTQAIGNLLSNAIKYSKSDSLVRIVVRSRENAIQIDVIDNGVGVPPAELESIFQPFCRASNAAHVKGNGIGLTAARLCAEAHGGTLSARSDLGRGSTFTLAIPIQKTFEEPLAPIPAIQEHE